jgi:hypothetical protein
MTIRDIINSYRQKLGNTGGLTRLEASQILVELSALIGNINDEIRTRDMAYYKRFDELISNEKISVAKAEIKMRAGVEYNALMEAKNLLELSMEMIRSLKYFCRSVDDEYQVSSNL